MKSIVRQLTKELKSLLADLGLAPKTGTLIGLDVGLRHFRAARVCKTGKGLSVKDSLVKELDYLKDLSREMAIDSDEPVFVNFDGEDAVIKRANVPQMPHNEIEGALKWQLKDQVKFDIDKAKVRFDILGEIDIGDGSKKIDLVAIVYREESVRERVSKLKGLGLNIQGVFPTDFAIAGYAGYLDIASAEERVVIADIGSIRTTIDFIENGKLSFAREVAVGGDNLTQAMTGVLASEKGRVELTRESAEKIKRDQGISEDIKILSMMRPVLERFSNEIRRSLEYYANRFKCERAKKMILAGGGSRLKGLKEYLSKQTGLEVLDMLPELACAAGLPLLEGSGINMIPASFRQEKKARVKRFSLRILSFVILSLFLFSYALLSIKTINLKNELGVYRPHWDTLRDVRSVKDKIMMFGHAVNVISHESIYTGRTMRELSNLTPTFIILDSLSIKNEEPNIKMSGVALEGERLSGFMSNLEGSPVFEKVKLVFSERNEEYSDAALNFEIVCDLVR